MNQEKEEQKGEPSSKSQAEVMLTQILSPAVSELRLSRVDEVTFAEQKIQEMVRLEAEVSAEAEKVAVGVSKITQKLHDNMYSSLTKLGLLRRHISKYTKFIKVDLEGLKYILSTETEDWKIHLADLKQRITFAKAMSVGKELKQAQEQIENLMEDIKIKMSPNIKIRRLPLFGEQIEDAMINFSFPSEGELKQMLKSTEDIILEKVSIEGSYMSGIRLHFTNEVMTPFYRTDAKGTLHSGTVDTSKRIKTISMKVDSSNNKIDGVRLQDETG